MPQRASSHARFVLRLVLKVRFQQDHFSHAIPSPTNPVSITSLRQAVKKRAPVSRTPLTVPTSTTKGLPNARGVPCQEESVTAIRSCANIGPQNQTTPTESVSSKVDPSKHPWPCQLRTNPFTGSNRSPEMGECPHRSLRLQLAAAAVPLFDARADSDRDGLPDGWELANGLNPYPKPTSGKVRRSWPG
jgi:hypothetical protein